MKRLLLGIMLLCATSKGDLLNDRTFVFVASYATAHTLNHLFQYEGCGKFEALLYSSLITLGLGATNISFHENNNTGAAVFLGTALSGTLSVGFEF